MRPSSQRRVLVWTSVVALMIACKLEPPPAVPEAATDSASDESPEQSPPSAEAEPGAPEEGEPTATAKRPLEPGEEGPAPPGEENATAGGEGSNVEALMAAPTCDIKVVSVLKAGRAFWSGVGKYTCTYEIMINGAPFKYTRLLPRERKREPGEACDRSVASMESAVRTATHGCKDLTVTDKTGESLIPLR